jgi:hypothetical protein
LRLFVCPVAEGIASGVWHGTICKVKKKRRKARLVSTDVTLVHSSWSPAFQPQAMLSFAQDFDFAPAIVSC